MLTVADRVVDDARLNEICDAYGIAELVLFGSAARATIGPSSDIDLLYSLRPGRTLGWEIEDLADELADLFGRPVDLVSRRALHTKLRDQVLAEARPLYAVATAVPPSQSNRPRVLVHRPGNPGHHGST
jgi:uncharacterized protein